MEFPPREKPSKSKGFCSVYGCSSKASRCPQLSFHKFPKPNMNTVRGENKYGIVENIALRKAWQQRLEMVKKVTKYMRVCSLHFQVSDYFPNANHLKTRRLKKDAIPTMNLPKPSPIKSKERQERLSVRRLGTDKKVRNTSATIDGYILRFPEAEEDNSTIVQHLTEKSFQNAESQIDVAKLRTICDNYSCNRKTRQKNNENFQGMFNQSI